MFGRKFDLCRAFSLFELLVALGVLVILSALAFPVYLQIQANSNRAECRAKIRNLGLAITTYAAEHNGEFPRSLHSAGAHRQPGWTQSLFAYLAGDSDSFDDVLYQKFFRCPEHREKRREVFSYGLNVHFELDPNGDDYFGSPSTWRKISQIPWPSCTILVAEPRPVPFGDHIMSHLWRSQNAARNALARQRHKGRPSFLFVDGHVENLPVEMTFNPARGINLWNPSVARPGEN